MATTIREAGGEEHWFGLSLFGKGALRWGHEGACKKPRNIIARLALCRTKGKEATAYQGVQGEFGKPERNAQGGWPGSPGGDLSTPPGKTNMMELLPQGIAKLTREKGKV